MKKKLLLSLVFLCIYGWSNAQTSKWLWGVEGGNSGGTGTAIVSDQLGNIYITGYFSGSLALGDFTVSTGGGGIGTFIAKYDSGGNSLWATANQDISGNYSAGAYMATDKSNNCYLTGFFGGSIKFGNITLNAGPGIEAYVVKYNSAGEAIWARQSTSTNYVFAEAAGVTTDGSGNVYIGGFIDAPATFGSINLPGSGAEAFYIVKYDSAGNLLWAKQPDYSNNAQVWNMATDKQNNLYVCGPFTDSLRTGNLKLYNPRSATAAFVLKMDSDGNNLWGIQSGCHALGCQAITLDKYGNGYLTGAYLDTVSFGADTVVVTPYQNAYLTKINANGKVVWVKSSDAVINGNWMGCLVSADTMDDIFLACGQLNAIRDSSDIIFGKDTFRIRGSASSTDGNSVLLKLDTAGNVQCGVGVAGGSDGEDNSILVASPPSGQYVYFGGVIHTPIRFGPDTLSATNAEPFVAQWEPCDNCNMQISFKSPATICGENSDTLIVAGGTSYAWSPSTGLSATTGSSVLASPTVTTTYQVTARTGICSGSVQMVVTVIPSPNKPSFIQHNDTLVSSSKHDNQWYRNDTLLKSDTSQYLIINTLGWYWVEVNNEVNGCSTASDTMNISSLTGVKQLPVNNNQLSIYPNPTSNQLTVESGQMTVNEITITNLLGQTELKSPSGDLGVTKQTIDVSSLADGLYFITVNTDTGTVTDKFVVAR